MKHVKSFSPQCALKYIRKLAFYPTDALYMWSTLISHVVYKKGIVINFLLLKRYMDEKKKYFWIWGSKKGKKSHEVNKLNNFRFTSLCVPLKLFKCEKHFPVDKVIKKFFASKKKEKKFKRQSKSLKINK